MGVGLTDVSLLILVMQGFLCKKWDITLPKSIIGFKNSCVTLPCLFNVPRDQEANLVNCSNRGLWLKGFPFVLNSQGPSINIIHAQIVGDITKKNCTTVIQRFSQDDSMYFFRLNCPDVKYTFSQGVSISVQSDPPPPLLTSLGQVSEGAEVSLRCSVPVVCSIMPPSLTWLTLYSSRQEESQTLQNANGQMILTSTLTFIASADHHNQTIICSVSYPLSKGGSSKPAATSQRMNIQYAPRFTKATINTSAPVPEGSTVRFTCSSEANPPVGYFTWFREKRWKLTAIGRGKTLDLQVKQEDSGGYLCEAGTLSYSERSGPVFLQVSGTRDISKSVGMIPYLICGVVMVLFILTISVNWYKYQSLSRRLKTIEMKNNDTYAELNTLGVTPDYDQLQLQQPKPKPSPQASVYENSNNMQAPVKNQPQANRT